MGLLRELRDDIVDSNKKLSNVLRKAKILASILKNENLKKWVDSELNGYTSAKDVPDYRRGITQSYGYFVGIGGSVLKNAPIPTINLPKSIQKLAGEITFVEGVRGLESLLESDLPSFMYQWPADIIPLIQDKIYRGCNCISAWRAVGRGHIEQILDTVRNRLLNVVLELQEKYPDIGDSEAAIANIPQDQVSSVVNTYIYGSHNIVASGQNIDQTVMQEIIENDLDSLLSYMKKTGVSDEDIIELKEDIETDGARTEPHKFGPKVVIWIGKMVKKILEGTWKVAISTAPSLLTKALSKYYGWE